VLICVYRHPNRKIDVGRGSVPAKHAGESAFEAAARYLLSFMYSGIV